MVFFEEAEGKEFSRVVDFATKDSGSILEEVRTTILSGNLVRPIIADYGGGTGDLLNYVQQGVADIGVLSEVYNIDIDPAKLKDFKETESRHAILANLSDIPLESNFFDIGLSRLVFQYLGHFDKQLSVLEEIYRTLKTGATLYLQVIYASNQEVKRQFNESMFEHLEDILIRAGKMYAPLCTDILTENEFYSMLESAKFTSFSTLRKSIPIPMTTSELRNRYKLSSQAYAEMVDLFDSFQYPLKKNLDVKDAESDRKFVLPTLLIEATK